MLHCHGNEYHCHGNEYDDLLTLFHLARHSSCSMQSFNKMTMSDQLVIVLFKFKLVNCQTCLDNMKINGFSCSPKLGVFCQGKIQI